MYYVNIKKTGWRVYRNSLHYLFNFSTNLNLSQDKKFILKEPKLWLWVVEEVWHMDGQCRRVQADYWSLFSISYWKGKGSMYGAYTMCQVPFWVPFYCNIILTTIPWNNYYSWFTSEPWKVQGVKVICSLSHSWWVTEPEIDRSFSTSGVMYDPWGY